jgi:hypothetical protein
MPSPIEVQKFVAEQVMPNWKALLDRVAYLESVTVQTVTVEPAKEQWTPPTEEETEALASIADLSPNRKKRSKKD